MRPDEVLESEFVLLVESVELGFGHRRRDSDIDITEQDSQVLIAGEGNLVEVLSPPLRDDLFWFQYDLRGISCDVVANGNRSGGHCF
jgi:hypothetical protein